MNREPHVCGTLEQQLDRCNREIQWCENYLSNPNNPDRFGAELGLLDWLINREEIMAELSCHNQTNSDFEGTV